MEALPISLHRISTTRLFQTGVDRKLVPEFTEHVSDAVDKYQLTSEGQREDMSKILKGDKCSEITQETTKQTDDSVVKYK